MLQELTIAKKDIALCAFEMATRFSKDPVNETIDAFIAGSDLVQSGIDPYFMYWNRYWNEARMIADL